MFKPIQHQSTWNNSLTTSITTIMDSIITSIKELTLTQDDYSKLLNLLASKAGNVEFKEVKSKGKSKRVSWKSKLEGDAKEAFDNIPKKLSAYSIFMKNEKDKIKEEKEEKERFTSTAGRLWKDMDDEDKEQYVNESTKSKKAYEKGLKKWKKEYPEAAKLIPKTSTSSD